MLSRSVGRILRGAVVAAVALAAPALFSAPAHATDYTLTAAPGGSWSTGAWSPSVPPTTPPSGDTTTVKIFNGNAGAAMTTNMDIPGLTIDRLDFQATNIKIAGSETLGLRSTAGEGGISDVVTVGNAGFTGNELALNLNVSGRASVTSIATTLLKFSGLTTVPAGSVLAFRGNADTGSTITGTLAGAGVRGVATGVLQLNNPGSNAAVTGTEIGAGLGFPGAPPILRLGSPNQIADNVRVFVNPGGTFDVAPNLFDTIGDLAVIGGTVTMGGGTLTVNGTTSMTGGSITGSGTPSLKLRGNVSATGGAAISATMSLNGARTFTIADDPLAAEDLSLTNTIENDLTQGSLTKAGAGTLALKPSSSNLYTGGTTIADGTLFTTATSGRAIPVNGTLTVGDATGDPSSARVRFGINNDIDQTTAVVVRSDGLVDTNGFNEAVASLTMNGGSVVGTGILTTGSVAATGPGASVSAPLRSPAFTTTGVSADVATNATLAVVNVTPGTSASGKLTKTGAGTAIQSGTSTLPGGTDVLGGTLNMLGSNGGKPVFVAQGALLGGSGTVGDTTVAGTLVAGLPLRTGNLTFAPTGALAVTADFSGTVPSVDVTGTTTIQPGAQLLADLTAMPVTPAGTQKPLLTNDGADAISGQFANAPQGFAFTSAASQPFTTGYAGVDGNDLSLTAGDIPVVVVPPPPDNPPVVKPPPIIPPAKDTTKPKLTFTVSKSQKLAKKGTFAVKLACNEACTTTLSVTVTPPVKKAKAVKVTQTIKLRAGSKATTVNVAVPKKALDAVRKALKGKKSVTVSLSASAKDAAGNKSSTASAKTTLKP